MFGRCIVFLVTVRSPHGLQFQLSADEAVARVRQKYGRRWFGAAQEFLHLRAPSMEFLPFYYCEGSIHGTFQGIVNYGDTTTDSKGKLHSTSRQTTTAPQPLDSAFGPNKTQMYAGYKYNIHHVHTALRNEENPLHLCKMTMMDVAHATTNPFEQSTETLEVFVKDEVRRQAEETARAMIRSYHPGASSISVDFLDLTIELEEVTPVFVPCYVVKAEYDAEEYTLYVSGVDGTVGGPFLLNALYIGRVSALGAVALSLMLSPAKATGLAVGFLLALPTYYAAFYAAKVFPSHRRDHFRWKRQQLRVQHEEKDRSGFCPDAPSRRLEE